MAKNKLHGILPPIVTPFTSDSKQEINEEALRAFINFLIENGVHGVIPCGGCGEYTYLSFEEHQTVTAITVDEVNGRVPVIAGACNSGTKNAVLLAKNAENCGADGVMVETPYNPTPTNGGIYQHYKTMAEAIDIPIMLYNYMPHTAGFDIDPSVVARLINDGIIQSIKNSTKDMYTISELIRLCTDKVAYLQGWGECLLPSLRLGGKGCITSHSNTAPQMHVELFEAFQRGDYNRAEQLHNQLLPLWKLGGSPVLVKEALTMMGHPVGPSRKPSLPATTQQKKKVKDILTGLNLI